MRAFPGIRLLSVFTLILSILVAIPASTAAQTANGNGNGGTRGNSGSAHLCQQGGWEEHGRQGNRQDGFRNTGDCVRHGAQGGEHAPLLVPDLSISGGVDDYNGVLTGSGFTPNSSVSSNIAVYGNGDVYTNMAGWVTDANGNFLDDAGTFYCIDPNAATVAITITTPATATDAAVTYTEAFLLDCTGGNHT